MLSINISELIWTVINFFLLLYVLNRFLFQPVLRFTEDRKARIDEGVEAKKNAESAETELKTQLEAELQTKRAEAKTLLADEKLKDDKRFAETLTEARQNAARVRRELRAEADAAGQAEQAQLDSMQDELAARLAEKLLGGTAE